MVILMYYILYNPLSSNGTSKKHVEKIEEFLKKENNEYEIIDLVEASKNVDAYASKIHRDDTLIIIGGDGTLHRFVNGIRHIQNNSRILLYRGGTGNDFSRDFQKKMLIDVTNNLKNLPIVTVNGHEELFLNGCGFGVDGEVCLMVNDRANKKKGLNYLKSAIMLLKKFKRYDLEIEIDGVRHTYKNVWFTVINNGKYFGGGMKITPSSDRNDRILEACIIHSVSFFKILLIFPLLFIGKHIWFKHLGISIIQGQKFKAVASKEQVFQTDGEVLTGVKEYEVLIAE